MLGYILSDGNECLIWCALFRKWEIVEVVGFLLLLDSYFCSSLTVFTGSTIECPSNTYGKWYTDRNQTSACRSCPDINHISPNGSTTPRQCVCKRGYVAGTTNNSCLQVSGHRRQVFEPAMYSNDKMDLPSVNQCFCVTINKIERFIAYIYKI